jgi:OFA family oxalate/formate antiporter-like MFS transporter
VASVAGLLYGCGYLVASWAVAHHSLAVLYLGYGVIGGVGGGMGYICPIATLVKWFPERRGLMTGIAVCGYGMGALAMSAIAAPQIATRGIPATFASLGLAYLALIVLAAQFCRNPRLPLASASAASAAGAGVVPSDFTTREALRTPQFWLLWFMLFLNVSAGIMIISQASPMAQQLGGMTPIAAAGVVGVIAIFNGLGRVVWAAISDYIGRVHVFTILFAMETVVFLALPKLHSGLLFTAAVALIGFAYGGGFGTMPALTADLFGSRYIGGIYGCILLAWGLGAVPSPLLIAYVRQQTGQYTGAIYVIAAVVFLAIALPLTLRKSKPQRSIQ